MHRRFALGSRPILAVLIAALLLVARPVLAQSKAIEAQARGLQKKAMEDDYLATDFAKAQDKLNQAIAKCGTEKCSVQLRATLKRDLGMVQIGGQLDKDKGNQNFAEAQALDPALGLDPDLKTKELEAAWDAAKKPVAVTPATPTPTNTAPTGDFTHTPATEQLVRTPVPIYVEYGGSETIVKIVIRYKGFGMTEFKSIEAKKNGKGYGVLIPCMDVQQGEMLYYIQGFNEEKDVVATSGDRNRPYKVAIKREKIEGDAPHLPGEPPPTQCADTGDCPPDFPGCKGGGTKVVEKAGKPEGEDCDEDEECSSKACKAGKCATAGDTEKPKFRRVWVGLSVAMDFTLLSSADDVCKLGQDATPTNTAGYYCTNPGGNTDYPSRTDPKGVENSNIVLHKSDKVSGGTTLGNVRIQATLDFALSSNFMLGARVGYNLLTYPGTAAVNDGKASSIGFLHLEARATYLIGRDPLARAGMAGYVYVGAGYSEFTGKVSVTVVENGSNSTGGKAVDAWAAGGPIFGGVGGGIRYAISPRAAIMGGPRMNFAFGNNFAPSAGLEGGVQFGF